MKYLIALIALMTIAGCEPGKPSADAKLAAQTEQSMKEANAQIGMPAIVNYQERKLAKMIFELRDQENVSTHAYIVNKMTGKLIYVGKCIGYGLPYSVQFTSPQKLVTADLGTHYGHVVMPQADPNGLFMPSGLSATWLMMVDPKTHEPRPVYFEPEIVVSPFKLH